MRHRSCFGLQHRHQMPSRGGMIVAIASVMMLLGLICGKEAATFLGPAMDRLPGQLTVTPGRKTIASAQSSLASSFPWARTIKSGRAAARATDVFWAFALLAGACSIRKMASRSASQHKHRSCNVACQAADVPRPVMFQPRIPVVEELTPTTATMVPTPILMQQCISLSACTTTPQMMLESHLRHDCWAAAPMQVREPPTAARPATMVGGARCTTAAKSSARQAKRRTAAAASRAARQAVGSRLQAASCKWEVPSLTFDASHQRLKIQAGLCLAKRERLGHMREIKTPGGVAEKSNGFFTTRFCMMGDFTYSTKLGIFYCALSHLVDSTQA